MRSTDPHHPSPKPRLESELFRVCSRIASLKYHQRSSIDLLKNAYIFPSADATAFASLSIAALTLA
jgi:hypothetical protein